ncbi:MAG: hypothetical protein JSW07_07330 [bacterium]|nr:MAG: hypothetical protein JSW07_07330 [bacterium]
MKIRKSYQQQMNLLSYSRDNIQWDMLPPTVRDDVATLFAQLILSVHRNDQSLNREDRHVRENN